MREGDPFLNGRDPVLQRGGWLGDVGWAIYYVHAIAGTCADVRWITISGGGVTPPTPPSPRQVGPGGGGIPFPHRDSSGSMGSEDTGAKRGGEWLLAFDLLLLQGQHHLGQTLLEQRQGSGVCEAHLPPPPPPDLIRIEGTGPRVWRPFSFLCSPSA